MMAKSNSLTSGEIAKHCDVSLRTVIRWIEKGVLKGYKLPGRGNNRVKVEDFLEFLSTNGIPIPDEFRPTSNNILIVDDEMAVARAIQRVTMRAGYTSLIATDGFQAGAILASYKPSLMTLDLSMPGLNGFDVLKYTRQQPEFEDLKILVVSALGDKALFKALDLGADAIIEKPFDNKDLLNTIIKLLGEEGI